MSKEASRCLCNKCVFGPGSDDPVPERVSFDYESICAIAEEQKGVFRAGYVFPLFRKNPEADPNMICPNMVRFLALKAEKSNKLSAAA